MVLSDAQKRAMKKYQQKTQEDCGLCIVRYGVWIMECGLRVVCYGLRFVSRRV